MHTVKKRQFYRHKNVSKGATEQTSFSNTQIQNLTVKIRENL